MEHKEIRDAVAAAIKDSRFKWRTAPGISKDTGIPIQRVVEFLEGSKYIVRARRPNKFGQALYALRRSGLGDRLVAAILNKPE